MITDLLRLIDLAAEVIPQNRETSLESLKIIGHRGATGPGSNENLLASFAACKTSGIWGVEMDVRWTKDGVPVVLHDDSPERIFGNRLGAVAQVEFSRLRAQLKQLPTFAELVELIGKDCHLMIEVKEPLTEPRERSLLQALSGLKPERNYHLLTLHPEYLASATQIPRRAFVYVTELHPLKASKFVLERGWGGIAGHYFLLHPTLRARHHAAGQLVGVGFVNGINNLYRQIRLKADWIFSDRAVQLHHQIRAYLDHDKASS